MQTRDLNKPTILDIRDDLIIIDNQEEYEERAGIMEYCGGMSREVAEKKARFRILEKYPRGRIERDRC